MIVRWSVFLVLCIARRMVGVSPLGWDATTVAVGDHGLVLTSIDAGLSWTPHSYVDPTNALNSVAMPTDDFGTIVGAKGTFLQYYNGSWEQRSPFTTRSLHAVDFVEEAVGVAVGERSLWRTTDGGVNWDQDVEAHADLHAVFLSNTDIGTAVGDAGDVHSLWDGHMWVQQPIAFAKQSSLRAVRMVSAREGMAIALDGRVLRTEDGGRRWSEAKHLPETTEWHALAFSRRSNGVAVGTGVEGGVLRRTTDFGDSWDDVVVHLLDQKEPLPGLWAVAFSESGRVGLAVGGSYDGSPAILRTEDGGTVWDEVRLDVRDHKRLLAVTFVRRSFFEGRTPQDEFLNSSRFVLIATITALVSILCIGLVLLGYCWKLRSFGGSWWWAVVGGGREMPESEMELMLPSPSASQRRVSVED